MGKAEFDSLWAYMTNDVDFRTMLNNATDLTERMQILVAGNQDYLSYKCWEYERALWCWRMRESY